MKINFPPLDVVFLFLLYIAACLINGYFESFKSLFLALKGDAQSEWTFGESRVSVLLINQKERYKSSVHWRLMTRLPGFKSALNENTWYLLSRYVYLALNPCWLSESRIINRRIAVNVTQYKGNRRKWW